jgi:nucleoid DNA-binding protein
LTSLKDLSEKVKQVEPNLFEDIVQSAQVEQKEMSKSVDDFLKSVEQEVKTGEIQQVEKVEEK